MRLNGRVTRNRSSRELLSEAFTRERESCVSPFSESNSRDSAADRLHVGTVQLWEWQDGKKTRNNSSVISFVFIDKKKALKNKRKKRVKSVANFSITRFFLNSAFKVSVLYIPKDRIQFIRFDKLTNHVVDSLFTGLSHSYSQKIQNSLIYVGVPAASMRKPFILARLMQYCDSLKVPLLLSTRTLSGLMCEFYSRDRIYRSGEQKTLMCIRTFTYVRIFMLIKSIWICLTLIF